MCLPSNVLKVRFSKIYNPKVVSDIKIASVSDIHLCDSNSKDITSIVNILKRINPDYICFLGDFINYPIDINSYIIVSQIDFLIESASSIAPTFIILGNHDYIEVNKKHNVDIKALNFFKKFDSLENVYVLDDKIYFDDRIFIAGYTQKVDAYYGYNNLKKENPEAFYQDLVKKHDFFPVLKQTVPTVFLTHSPEPIHDKTNEDLLKDYDLILTGHYHNGCVPAFLDDILPKNMGLSTPRKRFFPRYVRGIRKLNAKTFLIYNGGWTKIHKCAVKLLQPLDKICNRQIDVTTLTSNIDNEIEETNEKIVLNKI